MSEYRQYDDGTCVDLFYEDYANHLYAMTSEELDSKSDIAWELAYRDYQIASLKQLINQKDDRIDTLKQSVEDKKELINDLKLSDSISKQELRDWVEENGELSMQKSAVPLGDDVTMVTLVLKDLLEKLGE